MQTRKGIRANFLNTLPRELEQMTWKICTPRCTPPFGRTHRLFQKPTRTRAKSPNSKTRRSSPQRKGGIMFSTRSSADAKKSRIRGLKKLSFQLDFLFFFHCHESKSSPRLFPWSIPGSYVFFLRLFRLPPPRIHRFICPGFLWETVEVVFVSHLRSNI